MAVDLIFQEGHFASTALDVSLVFGALDPPPGDSSGTGTIVLDALTVSGVGIVGETGTGTIPLDSLTVDGTGDYDNAVSRGPRASTGTGWARAAQVDVDAGAGWNKTIARPVSVDAPIHDAQALSPVSASPAWQAAVSARQARGMRWQHALAIRPTVASFVATEAVAARHKRTTLFEQARPSRPQSVGMAYQETIRTSRPSIATKHQEATSARHSISTRAHDAAGLVRSWVVPWQESKHPQPGRSVIVPVTPPPPDLCYTPPAGNDVPLVFNTRWDGSTELTFVCDNHPVTPPGTPVVVPIQEVYMVSNDVSLVLASDGTVIPTRGFTLSLDYTSWSWSFSARVPRAALPIFDMDAGGDPKVLTATVNGTAFAIVAESVDSNRQFNSADVTITGRGLIAGLADPYAPTLTFGNTADRTAQQLVADVLTNNGVSLGWAVDWQMTDWLVPAGAWSFQGTYMAAVQAIAAAAGGYVQPTANDQTVRILPLFPTAPWTWGTLTPDYSLPAAVVSREGITWSDLPAYNRVFVSGTSASGVLGDVKRTGTAGDFEKPMVTDQLITHADAARQRGIAELGVGGRSALVSLQLPVLAGVGVILPGKTVSYVDGATTRKGIVRSVSVEAGYPTVYQTIGVETHV